jgi:hypothetical protein
MNEYWEEQSKNPKFILLIGITLVILSIFFSFLSLTETSELKMISGETELPENSSKEISLINKSQFSFSYIKNGNITFFSNSTFYISFSDESKYYIVNKNGTFKLNSFSFEIFMFNKEPVKINYKAVFQLITKPYIYLAFPSLFMVIVGAILSFAGVYLTVIKKYHH